MHNKTFEDKVKEKLQLGWNPSQIARHLKCSDMRVTRAIIRLEKRKDDST